MNKKFFTLDDGHEKFEGYTDGSYWNGWSSVNFTREQLQAYMDTTPYDLRFLESGQAWNKKNVAVAVLGFEDEEIIESVTVEIDGNPVEVFPMEGFCFIDAEE